MKKNLLLNTKVIPALNPVTEQGAAVKGLAIDRTGSLSGIVSVGVGAVSGTPTSFSVAGKLQHSDTTTDGDFADVTGYTLTALTAINTNTFKGFNLNGLKKYIRVVITPTFVDGTTPKIYITSSVALGDAIAEPVS